MMKNGHRLIWTTVALFFSFSVMPLHFLRAFDLLSVSFHVLHNTVRVPVVQSRLTLCDPTVHGVFQARILEWVAIFLSQGIFRTQD